MPGRSEPPQPPEPSGLGLLPAALRQRSDLRIALRWLKVPYLARALSGPAADLLLGLLRPAERDRCLARRRPAEGVGARLAAKMALLDLLMAREAELGQASVLLPNLVCSVFPCMEIVNAGGGSPSCGWIHLCKSVSGLPGLRALGSP